MKTPQFLVFLFVVLSVYSLVNIYIFTRAMQAIPCASSWRPWFIALFWFVVSAFVLARILERYYPCDFTEFVTWIGSFWLGFMLYFFLAVIVIDLARLINHFFHLFPSVFYTDYQKTKLITLVIVTGLVTITVIAGFINARNPRIKVLNLDISKSLPGRHSLKIVMASDIHLGTLIAKRRAEYLVSKINSLKPDIILLAGDVVDEDIHPVIRRNIGETLSELKAPFGTFAITGNHEYIGGVKEAVKYLKEHGITMLQDTVELIENKFYLVGREDRDKPRFTGQPRKSLEALMQGVDLSKPVILLDHQPFNLTRAAKVGADLQLSGHTHHGQLWPFNWITDAIYELSWGYKKIGQTHFYVSSGFGTWGPPLRLGNIPEIVEINLRFR